MMDRIPDEFLEKIKSTGIDIRDRSSTASYIQIDDDVVKDIVLDIMRKKGIIVEPLDAAMDKYEWVEDYLWGTIEIKSEKPKKRLRGYFIYVPKNLVVKNPIQACFLVSRPGFVQEVHNLVVIDENAELNLLTGCTTAVNEGFHLGISEFYIKKSAKLTYTMIHNWTPDFKVRPITGVIVEENGEFISNYINFAPGSWMKANPKIYLKRNAKTSNNSLIIGKSNAFIDNGPSIFLEGEGARAEIISRAISFEKSQLIMRGEIIAKAPNTKGHIECKGLTLSKDSIITAVPVLESQTTDSELTHEASIGKISREQIEYLMARGFTEDEAISLIVRGFMDIEILGLTKEFKAYIRKVLDQIAESSGM